MVRKTAIIVSKCVECILGQFVWVWSRLKRLGVGGWAGAVVCSVWSAERWAVVGPQHIVYYYLCYTSNSTFIFFPIFLYNRGLGLFALHFSNNKCCFFFWNVLNLFLHTKVYILKSFIIFLNNLNLCASSQGGAQIQIQAAGFCHATECRGKYWEKWTCLCLCLCSVDRRQGKITAQKWVINCLKLWQSSNNWERHKLMKMACMKKLKTQ